MMEARTRWLLALTLLWGGGTGVVAMAETPFQAETRLLTQTLPCKWVSMGGRTGPSYGNGRFDFSCKGGTWGTVVVLLDDTAGFSGSSLGQVRFGYRDWDPAINPTAGEASVAEQYLQYVLNRFVPATAAAKLRDDFWQGQPRQLKVGETQISIKIEPNAGFTQRWLIVQRPQTNAGGDNNPVLPAVSTAWRQPTDGGLFQPAATTQPNRPGLPQSPVNLPLPTPTLQQGVRREAPLQIPANAPASPRPAPETKRGTAPQTFLESAASTLRNLVGWPANTSPSAPLPSPANLNRLNDLPPAQESRYRPAPPPPVSSSLVPAVETLLNNRPLAPSNFADYNQAEQLTQDLEARALAAQRSLSSTLLSPTVAVSTTNLQVAPIQPPSAQVSPTMSPAPSKVDDPRFTPSRDLPQLKFIPKAAPIDTRNDVIRFEDEGSKL